MHDPISTWQRLYERGATTLWLLQRCDPLPPPQPVGDAEFEAVLAYFERQTSEEKAA
jgi:hypothetical protein